MAYNNYNSILQVSPTTPGEGYREGLQQVINDQFENASNCYTIKYEQTLGKKDYKDIKSRVSHIKLAPTGQRIEDDWLKLSFKNYDSSPKIGSKYQFESFNWLAINADNIFSPTTSLEIRRCNHLLKWYSKDGAYREEECIIDYFKLSAANNVSKDNIMIIQDNKRYLFMQDNEFTNSITFGQRFIFNKMAWKVTNFDRKIRHGVLEIAVESDQKIPTDEMTNEVSLSNQINQAPVIVTTDNSEIIIGDSEIKIGLSKQFSIYKFINKIQQTDTYTFSLNSNSAKIISYTNNTLIIEAGKYTSSVILSATNTITNGIFTKTINLVALW